MASVILTRVSGGQNILSGAALFGSGGMAQNPIGGIQLKLSNQASGNAYIALSGNMTVGSGGILGVSGTYLSGLLDGIEIGPGQAFFVPRAVLGLSGNQSIYADCDPAASGQARLYIFPV